MWKKRVPKHFMVLLLIYEGSRGSFTLPEKDKWSQEPLQNTQLMPLDHNTSGHWSWHRLRRVIHFIHWKE